MQLSIYGQRSLVLGGTIPKSLIGATSALRGSQVKRGNNHLGDEQGVSVTTSLDSSFGKLGLWPKGDARGKALEAALPSLVAYLGGPLPLPYWHAKSDSPRGPKVLVVMTEVT